MYCSFYKIQEKPFSITPDPKFIYFGKTHKEAYAHLLYGIRERGGFIVVTGEIGSGKTTLCRALLTHLDQDTLVAFIFNPTLSATELLKTINEDFGIPSQGNTKKELIDEMNQFLLKKREEGKNPVLIVDEVQNLDMEVLEQIRLLSNLETDTEKLLQIILIGQPEFRDILEQPRLLQLNQRVTVRYHLQALTQDETIAYIRHRLSVVGAQDQVYFTSRAFEKIYRHTKGIPRLINVLCDRALLAGYSLKTNHIGKGIIKQAYKEVAGEEIKARAPQFRRLFAKSALPVYGLVIFAAVIIIALPLLRSKGYLSGLTEREKHPADLGKQAVLAAQQDGFLALQPAAEIPKGDPGGATPDHQIGISPEGQPEAATDNFQATSETEALPKKAEASSEAGDAIMDTAEEAAEALRSIFLKTFSNKTILETRELAFSAIMQQWHPLILKDDWLNIYQRSSDLYDAADNLGFRCYHLQGNINRIKALNLPVIMEFRLDEHLSKRYLALLTLDSGVAEIYPPLSNGSSQVPVGLIEKFWYGSAYLLWKDLIGDGQVLLSGMKGEAVEDLQIALMKMSYYRQPATGVFDDNTVQAVKDFQRDYFLEEDGIFGPETKIALFQSLQEFDIPRLQSDSDKGPAKQAGISGSEIDGQQKPKERY